MDSLTEQYLPAAEGPTHNADGRYGNRPGQVPTQVSLQSIHQWLESAGVLLTRQRVRVGRVLLESDRPLTPAEVFDAVNRQDEAVCRATVYNVLKLLVRRDLVRTVIADDGQTLYGPNRGPQYHVFNADTGELMALSAASRRFDINTLLPAGTRAEEVRLFIRVRNTEPA